MDGRYVVIVMVTMLIHQACSFPYPVPNDVDNNPNTPLVEISHQTICQKAVTELARDTAIQKRDDVFINLVVNVCFPDVDDASVLLQLIATFAGQLPVATTQAPWEDQWDFGLLPEVHSGQEGVDRNDVDNDFDQDAELIGGLPAELGPGQEGVDAGGNGGEEAGYVPDATNWWDGDFVDDSNTDMDNEIDDTPPTATNKKDRLLNLISLVLNNMFDNEVNDIISQYEDDSGSSSSSSSSSEEEEPVTSKPTVPTTELPITTQGKTESPTTVKVTTQPPTTKVTTQAPTTKVATQPPTTKVVTETPTDGVTTVAPTQPPLPSVNPNKKTSDDVILELLVRYAEKLLQKGQ